jgi:hypothetical protein
MQNTYLQSAELRFWKAFTPLMHHSWFVKKMVLLLFDPGRYVLSFFNDILDGKLQAWFPIIVVFLGVVAFSTGYMCGSWVR